MHNYDEFITTFLTMLAEQSMLGDLVQHGMGYKKYATTVPPPDNKETPSAAAASSGVKKNGGGGSKSTGASSRWIVA